MKTKALISFAVTAKLICVFVFAYAKSRFSHNEAHIAKLGFTGGDQYFLIFCSKNLSKEHHNQLFEQKKKNNTFFHLKIVIFHCRKIRVYEPQNLLFSYAKNKDADQLRPAADQPFVFRKYNHFTI